MMMDLYDQDRILEIHIANEKKIAAEEAAKEAAEEATKEAEKRAEQEKKASIERLLRLGKLSVEEIANCCSASADKVREVEAEMRQEGLNNSH